MQVESGADIPIENRGKEEVTNFKTTRIVPNDIEAINPGFDITPAKLIDVIVTEKGVVHNPDTKKMLALFG